LSIAQRLGYISVVDTLKDITEVTETIPASDDKYKVVSPETMQEAFLSDSEDEGGRLAVYILFSQQKINIIDNLVFLILDIH
jgi:ankyrin